MVLPSRENWNTYGKRAALGGRTPDWADLVRGKIAERGCTTTVSATAALSMQGRNRWIRFEELFFGTKAFARNMPRALDVVRLSKFRVPWVQTKRDKHPRLISYRPGWRSLVLVALKKIYSKCENMFFNHICFKMMAWCPRTSSPDVLLTADLAVMKTSNKKNGQWKKPSPNIRRGQRSPMSARWHI